MLKHGSCPGICRCLVHAREFRLRRALDEHSESAKKFLVRPCLKLRDYVAIIWGRGDIAVMGAGRGVGPKKLFMVHMTWSTGCRTSPPPRGGFSQHLPIFAWNMPVFSLAQYLHVGMIRVRPHGSGPHFSQFSLRDWLSGCGLIFIK